MPSRKLFYAIDQTGKRVCVDNLISKEGKFSCPSCKKEVVPKMGSEKIWHFAHVGEQCGIFNDKRDSSENKALSEFKAKESITSGIPECDDYVCPICNNVGKKINGIKFKEKDFLCKQCFTNYPSDFIDSYFRT